MTSRHRWTWTSDGHLGQLTPQRYQLRMPTALLRDANRFKSLEGPRR